MKNKYSRMTLQEEEIEWILYELYGIELSLIHLVKSGRLDIIQDSTVRAAIDIIRVAGMDLACLIPDHSKNGSG